MLTREILTFALPGEDTQKRNPMYTIPIKDMDGEWFSPCIPVDLKALLTIVPVHALNNVMVYLPNKLVEIQLTGQDPYSINFFADDLSKIISFCGEGVVPVTRDTWLVLSEGTRHMLSQALYAISLALENHEV